MSGSNLNQMQDEDIILLSAGNSMAESGGAGGHTGVISGGVKILPLLAIILMVKLIQQYKIYQLIVHI
ncbi:hypothetical protein AAFF39_06700 [Lactococcus garvieae]